MPESLYTRLGGSGGIRQIIEDLVAAHTKKPTLKSRALASCNHVLTCLLLKSSCTCADELELPSLPFQILDVLNFLRTNITPQEYAAVANEIAATLANNKIDNAINVDASEFASH